MASLLARAFNKYILWTGMKKNAAKRYRNPDRNPHSFEIPKRFEKKYQVEKTRIKDRRVITLTPKSISSDQHIIYLHGGAYISEITKWHWRFIDKIIEGTGVKMTVVEYPLAPEHQYGDTYAMVLKTYERISTENSEKIILMGDSAGGGLALCIAQSIVNEKKWRIPSKVVLISPWMDLSISTYIPPELSKKDVMLNLDALHIAASYYAGQQDQKHPQLSPLFGDYGGLPPVGIWTGDSEIVVVDMPELKSKLLEAGVPYRYTEGQDMQHVYPLFPIKEGREAIRQICDFIK